MTRPLVSCVVPMYNCFNFIEECIDSLVRQTYPNIEIIVVNDGSTDGCEFIIEKLKREHPITLVHQQNSGQSAARNRGMLLCKGDYITFVDADDFLASSAIEIAVNALSSHRAEVVLYDMIIYTPEGEKGRAWGPGVFKRSESCISPQEDDRSMFFTNAAPSVIDLQFLRRNEIKFTEGVIYEDWEFMSRVFSKCSKCVLVSDGLYYYRRDFGNSQTTSNVSEKCLDMFLSYKAADAILIQHPNLRYTNDFKLLVETCSFYDARLKYSRNIKLKIEFNTILFEIVKSFSPIYFMSLYGKLDRRQRRNFRRARRAHFWLRFITMNFFSK